MDSPNDTPPLKSPWTFAQWFRKMKDNQPGVPEDEADHLTSVEFSETGEYLATGDRSGNLVVLKQTEDNRRHQLKYTFATEFVTHYPQFDFVKSQNIDEAILSVNWGPTVSNSLSLLVSNQKAIKLFRVKPRTEWEFSDYNLPTPFEEDLQPVPPGHARSLVKEAPLMRDYDSIKIPSRRQKRANVLYHRCRRNYSEGIHFSDLVGLSMSPDKNNFLSADQFQINLWDVLIENKSFNVLDISPEGIIPNVEAITGVDFNPINDSLFLYSTSHGNIRLSDMRQRALTDYPVKTFPRPRSDGVEVGYSNIGEKKINVVSKAKFSMGGRFIISRDYMSVKIWDMNMEKQPVDTYYIHEFVRPKLFELNSAEKLDDQFGFDISGRGNVVTGTYGNFFHILDLSKKNDTFIEASKAPMGTKPIQDFRRQMEMRYVYQKAETNAQKKKTGRFLNNLFTGKKKEEKPVKTMFKYKFPYERVSYDSIDFTKKVLSCAWHPKVNGVAVAGQNNLYIYSTDLS
eukprot:maker-scaffold_2-snap-gene-27.5-mRNA-1 protein AED:0.00 eAED:0.00 QI:171/1/1/1/1/1/2/51/512